MKTFKILGLLLTYPEGTLLQASDELMSLLRQEALLSPTMLKRVDSFLRQQKEADIFALQEEYVDTFDRGRAHCLHLFEHVHGESRDRGQAMVDLSNHYAEKGLHINAAELPDYLPLFLEYLSMCELKEATELLGEAIDVIAAIGAKLKKRQSAYHVIFAALEELSSIKADAKKLEEALKNMPADPQTLEELDKEWEEAAAFTGDAEADCRTCNVFPNATHALQQMVGEGK